MPNSTLPDAVAALAGEFLSIAMASGDFAEFERGSVEAGFAAIRGAMSMALEALDDELAATARPEGCAVHDRKERTLLTEVGQVTFSRRAWRTAGGRQFCLLDLEMSLPARRRLSPGAFAMVRDDALCGSYQNAADVLCRHCATKVDRATVMAVVREAAEQAAEADAAAVESLFGDGVAPAGGRAARELCVEADGTWVALQRDGRRKVEVKAVTAYAGKEERGGRTRRAAPVHSATVGAPAAAWMEAVARIGSVYDLGSVETVHLGSDGERWCKAGGAFFPGCEVVGHLDRWHLFEAVRRGLGRERGAEAARAIGMLDGGDVAGALAFLGGLDDPDGKVAELRSYVAGNSTIIGVAGPSLGTIECDNATVCKSRMAGRRSWSREGASAMARLLSLKASAMPVPGQRGARRERVWEIPSGMRASEVVQSVGSGYEPPAGHLNQNCTHDHEFIDWAVNGNWR